MRRAVKVLALSMMACTNSPPANRNPPSTVEGVNAEKAGEKDPASRPGVRPSWRDLEGKTVDEQCKLLAPRVEPCVNEILVAAMVPVDAEVAESVEQKLAAQDRRRTASQASIRKEAEGICAAFLYAGGEQTQARLVWECWAQTKCSDFVACAFPVDRPD